MGYVHQQPQQGSENDALLVRFVLTINRYIPALWVHRLGIRPMQTSTRTYKQAATCRARCVHRTKGTPNQAHFFASSPGDAYVSRLPHAYYAHLFSRPPSPISLAIDTFIIFPG